MVGKGRLLGAQEQALYWQNGQVKFLNVEFASLLSDGSSLLVRLQFHLMVATSPV